MFPLNILLILINVHFMTSIDPLVLTSKGLIQGISAENGNYAMFLGIPYAVVDVNNPFGDSKIHPGFNTTYEASHDTDIICPQYGNGAATGTIDCLHLNVYVPTTSSSQNSLPVMVFVHGGGFIMGNGNRNELDPIFLVRHEVIVVTLNYRLGPYGFLCLSTPGFNKQGVKDQILALRWVKDNINAFGGDVNKITVFGQSAGAMSLDFFLLSLEDKLFHRAIIQSGPVLSPWVVTEENDNIVLSIARELGYFDDDIANVIDFLSTRHPTEIINVANDLLIITNNGHPLTKPCIDRNSEDSLLSDFPTNVQPKVKDLEIMIGYTNKENIFIYPTENSEFYENFKFEDEIIKDFNVIYDEDIVKQFYIGGNNINQEFQSEILDFGSDFAFYYPTERTVNRYLLNGASKIYRYVFAYEGGRNYVKIRSNLTIDGASHSDDLGYLFDSAFFTNVWSNKDQLMIDRMTTMWTNFAKYGDPTPSTSELIPVKWPPVTSTKQPYMLLDSPLEVKSRPFHNRMAFWDIYYKLYYNVQKGHKGN